MKPNYKHLLLSTATALLLTACGGGSGDNAPVSEQPAKENPTVTGKLAKVQLGALAGATVEIYELGVTPYKLLFTEITSSGDTVENTGNFDAHHTELDDEKFYLYTVSNGLDVDANDDGVIDAIPTINKGSFHAIVQGKSVKKVKGDFKVTTASELLYKKVKGDIDDTEKLETKLDNAAKEIFEKDINDDSSVTSEDILQYNPVEHKEVFKEAYQEQLPQIIKDIHDDKKVIEKQAPTANAGSDTSIMIGSSVTLKASGLDMDGSIVTYNWSENGNPLSEKQSFTYKPTTLGAHTLTLTVTDNDNLEASDRVLITVVEKPNTAPTAKEASYTLEEDTSKSITLEGSDADSDALTYKVVVNPTYGTLRGEAPNLTYIPNDNYNGSDRFIFVTNDGKADSKRTEIKLTIIKVNNRPVINPTETIQTNEDSTKRFTLSSRDTDGDTLTYKITTPPTNGTLTHKGAEFIYTPKANYNGSDSFGVKSNDGSSDSDEVTIMISVTAVNDAPTVNAGADTSTTVGTPVTLTATANDVDGEIKSYKWFEGDKELSTTQTATYTPTTVGAHTLSVTATDDKGARTTDRVLVTATAKPNTAPTAIAQSVTMDEDTTKVITLAGTDADQDNLTYTIKTEPSKGKLTGTAPNLRYTPNKDYFGADSFTFIANDGKDDSAPATVSIMIADVEEPDTVAPVITLKGNATLSLIQNTTYTDAGATATDDRDGTITVTTTGTVDTAVVGTYTITYTATDKAGNKATKKRIVTVKYLTTVALGSLANAKVEIYEVNDDGSLTLKWNESTSGGDTLDEIGRFDLHGTELDANKFYLYKVIGGMDWDANSDGVKDNTSIKNKGTIKAIAKGSEIQEAGEGFRVTIASEIVYEKVAKILKHDFHSNTFGLLLNQTASSVVKDVDGNGDIDNLDTIKFNPAEDRDKLVQLYKSKLNEIADIIHQDKIVLLNIDSILGTYDTSDDIPGQPLGYAMDLKVSSDGTKVYMADNTSGLVIIDITNPTNPIKLGQLDAYGSAKGISISKDGTKAYMTSSNRLEIIDITNPANPTKLGFCDIGVGIGEVTLSDDSTKAYVADGSYGLVIIDITNSANPTKISSFDTNYAQYVTLSSDGTKAYVSDHQYNAGDFNGLIVLDITDPANPTKLGSYSISSYMDPEGLTLSEDGTKAYLTGGGHGFVILDITDSTDIKELGAYDISHAKDVTLSNDGKKAYVGNSQGLVILDITNPAHITPLNFINADNGSATAVVLSNDGTTAYLSDGRAGLVIIDINNPTIVTPLKSVGMNSSTEGVTLSSDGTKAYTADYWNGLGIVDITDPIHPTKLGSYDTDDRSFSVKLSSDGNTAYVCDYISGLVIVDITDPSHPAKLSSYSHNIHRAVNVAISKDGAKAYVAGLSTGLTIVDITDPVNPTEIGSYATETSNANDVVLSSDGTKAYVSDFFGDGLVILDIQNPEKPTLLGSYKMPDGNGLRSVTLSSDGLTAYVANGDDGLIIIDISNPENPTKVGQFDTNYAERVTLSSDGTKAYIVDKSARLIVVDVTSPAHPTKLASYDTLGHAYDVTLSSDSKKAYVASGGNGIAIIDLELYK